MTQPGRRRFLAAALAATAAPLLAGSASAATADPYRFAASARGVNVPGWLDEADGVAPSDAVLQRLSDIGLRTIRLPIDPYLLRDGRLTHRLEEALRHFERFGLPVLLDLHPKGALNDLLQRDLAAATGVLVDAWGVLGRIVAATSPRLVATELLNEPPLTTVAWSDLRDRLADTVRRHTPLHTIVWGAARYQGIWETVQLPPTTDSNTIVAVHYYWPMGFTHQCQDWYPSPTAHIGNLPFPASLDDARVEAIRTALARAEDSVALDLLDTEFSFPWTGERIASDFDDLAAWSARTGTPVILNEFGALNACVDPASRTHWTRTVRSAAEARGIGWIYWELDQGFGLMADRRDTATFDPGLLEALLA